MKPINQWTMEDVENLQAKCDKILLRIIHVTIFLCGMMMVGGLIYQLLTLR